MHGREMGRRLTENYEYQLILAIKATKMSTVLISHPEQTGEIRRAGNHTPKHTQEHGATHLHWFVSTACL